jgi:hypothetical protein
VVGSTKHAFGSHLDVGCRRVLFSYGTSTSVEAIKECRIRDMYFVTGDTDDRAITLMHALYLEGKCLTRSTENIETAFVPAGGGRKGRAWKPSQWVQCQTVDCEHNAMEECQRQE